VYVYEKNIFHQKNFRQLKLKIYRHDINWKFTDMAFLAQRKLQLAIKKVFMDAYNIFWDIFP